MEKTDIIVIGAGPIGLFSIFQAGMLGMKCHIVDSREMIGGQCTALYGEKPIYDIPAYPKITASDLIEQLRLQALPFHPTYHMDQSAIELKNNNNNFQITTSKNIQIESKIIVIAAGPGIFGPNKPPLNRIEEFEGKSIFYCVNQISNFANKKVVIAGGGDSAVDWAISLSRVTEKIYLVHRREKFRAAPESLRQLKEIVETGKIELVINYQLDNLIGSDGILEGVEVRDLGNNVRLLEADNLLPFYGIAQAIGPIGEWGLNLHNKHIIVDPPYFETNIPSIYAIGDIATYPGKLKLILTGFSEAASAMHHAYNKVFDGKILHFQYSTTKGVGN
jgi:thioredoxin reductase (NADPH)